MKSTHSRIAFGTLRFALLTGLVSACSGVGSNDLPTGGESSAGESPEGRAEVVSNPPLPGAGATSLFGAPSRTAGLEGEVALTKANGSVVALDGWHGGVGGGSTSSETGGKQSDSGTTMPVASIATTSEPDAAGSAPVSAGPLCDGVELPGYRFASGDEFWLGSQASQVVTVVGAGYVTSRDLDSALPVNRYDEFASYSIAPDGALVDRERHPILGYVGLADGDCLSMLRAPIIAYPQPTTAVSISMNLDASAPASQFDVSNPESSLASLAVNARDSLGQSHALMFYFVKMGENVFEYNVLVDGESLSGGTSGWATQLGQGHLTFDSNGGLLDAQTPEIVVDFAGGATPGQTISVDFGPDIVNDGTTGLAGSTQFAAATQVWALDINGRPLAAARDVNVDELGKVNVNFEAGPPLTIGQLALARFPNESDLETSEDGSLRETTASGSPGFAVALSPGYGHFD